MENLTAVVIDLEEMSKGITGFAHFDRSGIDYSYPEKLNPTEDEMKAIREDARKLAIEYATEDCPWFFTLRDGKVIEVDRIK